MSEQSKKLQTPRQNEYLKSQIKSHVHTFIIKKVKRNISFDIKDEHNSPSKLRTKSKVRSKSQQKKTNQGQYFGDYAIYSRLLNSPNVFKAKTDPLKMTKFSYIKPIMKEQKRLQKIQYNSQIPITNQQLSRKEYKSQEEGKKKIRRKTSTNLNLVEDILLNSSKTQYEDYLNFIKADESKIYRTSFNFNNLRNMNKSQAFQKINHQAIKLLQGLLCCIYENLKNPNQTNQMQIHELCKIYFSCFQKIQFEVVLHYHYLKNLVFRIRPLFIYKRFIVFIFAKLSQFGLLFTYPQVQLFIKAFKHIKESFSKLYTTVVDIESDEQMKINETFKILKSIGQIERKLQIVEQQIKKVSFRNTEYIGQIERQLMMFNNKSEEEYPLERLVKTQMLLAWKYLRIPPVPFLPQKDQNKIYTLVLDLDETIISYNKQTKILKYRPFIDNLLKLIKPDYELVIFTSASKSYTDSLVYQIQKQDKYFDYCLFKDHLTLHKGKLIKDITKLGRNLNKTIIIDNTKSNFINCPNNGVQINSWYGDRSDNKLVSLGIKLKQIVSKNVEDVRQFLSHSKETLALIAEETDSECSVK